MLYAALLVWSYRALVAPSWSYYGYALGYWDAIGTAVGAAVVALTSWTLPLRLNRLTAWWRFSTHALILVPAAVLPWQTGWWSLSEGSVAMVGLVGAWYLFHLIPTPRTRFPLTGLRPGTFGALLLLSSLALGAFLVALLGVPQSIPGLLNVYGLRAEVKESVRAAGGLAGYVIPWGLNVLAPSLLAWGLWRRNWFLTGGGAAFIVALYSWTGQKSALLPLMLLPLMIGRGGLRVWRTQTALLGLSGIILVAAAIDLGPLGIPLATNLIVRRGLVVPGLLYAQYGILFAAHGYVFWSDSVLRFLEAYPYLHPRPELVGTEWVPQGKGTMWANASWWSDALSHAGIGGLWVTALLGGWIRSTLDWTTRGRPNAPVMGLLLFPVLALTNSGFFTTLLTHGFLLGWAAALFLPYRGFRNAHS